MTEETSFGKYIDALVQLKHKQLGHTKGLTDYISKDLASKSSLSARQIQRMRNYKYQEFPEGDAVTKLIKALPELETLRAKDICNRLLVPWQIIQREQQEITNNTSTDEDNHKITIVAGWEPPLGLLSKEVAISIANNIENNFQYEFIFPPLEFHPSFDNSQGEALIEQWLCSLRKIVELEWYSQEVEKFKLKQKEYLFNPENLEYQSNQYSDLDKKLQNFKSNLVDSIHFCHTPVKTNFWLLMPSSYVVLYNINCVEKDSSLRFGVFLVEGILMRSNHEEIKEITSKGWLYIYNEQYKRIEEEYNRIEKKLKIHQQ